MLLYRKIMLGLLALAVFIQQGSKTFVLLEYYLNKQYIATVLCENRNRPQLHCNGKCHLRKEMKKEEERQGNEKQNQNEKQEISCFENHSPAALNLARLSERILKTPEPAEQVYAVSLPAPFHPPCE